ncbi:MAG: cysteine--tRNA ligase [Candidatus Marinimicrobia bacterium]|nr:cysteine--tRNA ligase [Candidatus Neomarinimicrobiota bacterium]MBL7109965.1 cysteine--tRNA ligase [Candidatus Neomarinimicrobiota bacterium]
MIKFYNTLHRKVEEFTSIKDKEIRLYTCGPTVYDYAHIGNFRAYLFEDLMRRYLSFMGYKITHVMNITDIDDKTIRKSIEEKKTLTDFTKKYVEAFFEDIKTLNILPAHHYPKATEFIPQMIEMIQVLVDKGYGYTTDDGSVFFKISNFPDYGKLANLNPDEMRTGSRIESDEYEKAEGRDFVLWKSRKPEDGEVYWDSPWGEGRPGWHIECSAMSTHYLGTHFDIHCGGVDNIFPHHENEIAQSCAATGDKFVNYWIHNEHLLVDNKKMSKSLNNFHTLRDLLNKGYSPETIRYTLISTLYRQKLNFTFEKLEASQKAINRLRELKRRLETVSSNSGIDLQNECKTVIENIMKILGDDLNISGALGVLFTWVGDVFGLLDQNKVSSTGAQNGLELLDKIDTILGVINTQSHDIDSSIEVLIAKRETARKEKDWVLADEIRNQLLEIGIILEDTPDGPIWKKK